MKVFFTKNRFLYFLMLAFVFIASSSLEISSKIHNLNFNFPPISQKTKKFPPIPLISDGSSFPIISAEGVFALDLNSGVPLFEKNPDSAFLPASTTKIVTALVALDSYPLDKILIVPKNINVDGQKMGLTSGEKISVENLLYGLLVYSANDAAEVLAINYPGGRSAFIEAMNTKAKSLSMENTHFANPVGLDEGDQYSTARDLVRASEVAMRIPVFSKIVGTKQTTITDASGKIIYNLANINELLGVVPGVLGVKTGWTENARENLVTYLERDGHKIIIALLGSQDRFGETKELIDWIFANYKWVEVEPAN